MEGRWPSAGQLGCSLQRLPCTTTKPSSTSSLLTAGRDGGGLGPRYPTAGWCYSTSEENSEELKIWGFPWKQKRPGSLRVKVTAIKPREGGGTAMLGEETPWRCGKVFLDTERRAWGGFMKTFPMTWYMYLKTMQFIY